MQRDEEQPGGRERPRVSSRVSSATPHYAVATSLLLTSDPDGPDIHPMSVPASRRSARTKPVGLPQWPWPTRRRSPVPQAADLELSYANQASCEWKKLATI